jgi:hypothetical protein
MKRTAIVFVAVMVLLAGCGGGDGTVTPASSPTTESTSTPEMTPTDGTPMGETSTDGTPTDETPADGTPTDTPPSDGTPTDTPPPDDDPDNETDLNESAGQALQGAFNDTGSYEGPSRIDLTLVNGSRVTDLTVINDTEEELTIYNRSSFSGPTTYYVTDGPDAVRNLTSGETRYGTGDSTIQQSVGFVQGFTLLAAFIYVGIMDWEPANETTVDGETAFVLEADSINRSAFDDSQGFNFDLDPSEVNSAEGEMIITERGIRSLSVTVETPEGLTSVEMDVELGDDIEVDRPDWVDDSEFED